MKSKLMELLPNSSKNFMKAVRRGDLATVERIIANNPSVINAVDIRGDTALIWAACEGHMSIVQALVKAGANITVKNRGRTAAQIALWFEHLDIAIVLNALVQKNPVEQNTNYTVSDQNIESDWTPLMKAAFQGQTDKVKILLPSLNLYEINRINKSGNTALILAVQEGHVAVVKALLNHGALQLSNKDKKYPIHLVKDWLEMRKVFADLPNQDEEEVARRFEMVKLFLEADDRDLKHAMKMFSQGYGNIWQKADERIKMLSQGYKYACHKEAGRENGPFAEDRADPYLNDCRTWS